MFKCALVLVYFSYSLKTRWTELFYVWTKEKEVLSLMFIEVSVDNFINNAVTGKKSTCN